MRKQPEFKYNGIPVCKADYDALTELDIAKGKLDGRLDLAIKTLADLPVEIKDKNATVIQQFIDKTYINSVNGIKEKKQAILSKYPAPQRVILKKRLKTVAICLAVLLTVLLTLLSADSKEKETAIYLSPATHKYHTDYFCSALTGTDKANGAFTKKTALEEGYSPCANCSR